MSSTVELIKEKLSVVDVLSSYLKLEKAGMNFKAKCPFHNEKSPSFFVSPSRNSYYCFGCSAKGDIFTFVQEFEGLDFPGALKLLASRAGVEIRAENKEIKNERDRLFSVLEHATFFFQKTLGQTPEALLYLKRRGLAIETVREWRIGFAPAEWRSLREFLRTKGFADSDMEKAGLIKRSDAEIQAGTSREPYDRFRGRVMFPIFDSGGRVIGFSGRILVEDMPTGRQVIIPPKYLNSPETPLFNKSTLLYGFDKAKFEIKKNDSAILVEGQMDLLMSHQAGFKNTVAVSGTALTKDHVTLLSRLSSKLIMAFDSDKAGENAAMRSALIALSLGVDIRMVEIEGGKDPADLVLVDPNLWKTALGSAEHIITFVLHKVLKEKHESRTLGSEVQKKVLPYVSLLKSSIEQSHFIKEISDKTGIRENALWEDLKKTKPPIEGGEVPLVANVSPAKKDPLSRKVASLYFWQESQDKKDFEPQKIKEEVVEVAGEDKWTALLSQFEKEKPELIFEGEMYFGKEGTLQNIKETLTRFKEELLKEELEQSIRRLHEAEKTKNSDEAEKILARCQEIGRRLQELAKMK